MIGRFFKTTALLSVLGISADTLVIAGVRSFPAGWMHQRVLCLVTRVPCGLLTRHKSCCDFSQFLPARRGHIYHTGYVGKYRAGWMCYKHIDYVACDHPCVSYRGFVELFL